jgi:hypothetical protein
LPVVSRVLTSNLLIGTGGRPLLAALHVLPPSVDLSTRSAVPIGASLPTYIVLLSA